VRVLTTSSFYQAAPVVSILSIYYSFQFFGKITGVQLIFKKKTFVASLLTLLDIGLAIIISIPFIKKFGVLGAAWATLLGSMVTGYTAFYIAQRYFRIQWETKKIMFIFGIFCVSSLLFLFLSIINFNYIFRFALKLVFLSAYLFLGARLHIITKQNLAIMFQIVTFKKSGDAGKIVVVDSIE
jgi:O-antigen/teichoic acid export membrane protein